jgi:hypothetical protein
MLFYLYTLNDSSSRAFLSSSEKSQIRNVGLWNNGKTEFWNAGIMEFWNNGENVELEEWNSGMMEEWEEEDRMQETEDRRQNE